MPNEEAIRAELAEIRAALIAQEGEDVGGWKSPSQRSRSSETTASTASNSSSFVPCVSYDGGSTPLFHAIENRDWQEAAKNITPESAATWVIRTPEHETVFAWSHWKRLPLHEALRQQISDLALLHGLYEAHPAAIHAKTHYGETPLHVACDAGVRVAVLSWLVASCPGSCIVTDHSGRTPLEVLEDAAVLDPIEQAIAVGVLEATGAALSDQSDQADEDLLALENEHNETLCAVKKAHAQELEEEAAAQELLVQKVEYLQEQLREQTDIWCDRWQAAQDQIVTLKMESRRLQRELKKCGALKGEKKVAASRVSYRQREEVCPQLHAAHSHLAEAARTLLTIQDVINNELNADEEFDLTLQQTTTMTTTGTETEEENEILGTALALTSEDP